MEKDGKPWFAGKEIAEVLGYKNPSNALVNHVDDEDKTSYLIQVSGSNYKTNTTFVNESGLYSLILSSKLPQAKSFKHWVTSEVLPSIRKHGAYMTEATLAQSIINPDFLEQVAAKLRAEQQERLLAEQKAKQLQLENKQLQEKCSYLVLILASTTSVTTTQLAQDYGMSAKAFNQLLRKKHVQYLCGRQWILYQENKDKGYVTSETIHITHKDGTPFTVMHTKWLQKGRLYLYNTLKADGILPVIERPTVGKS